MGVFRKLLIPVDLSDRNHRAVAWSRELAREQEVEVTLLHVIETLDLPFEELEEFYRKLEARAAETMETLAAPLREAGVPVDQQVSYGKPAEEVVRYAEENGIDLIVLASHRVDLDDPGASWTTMSYKVAILAQSPVLLVKGTD